jgi:acyl-homoserine-lactone acylase
LVVSFVDGLNAWAKEHQADLSPEAKLVLPLTVDDVYAHCLRVIHYDWIINPSKLENRLRRAEVETHGSNEWAIAPSYSASGHAMLMSNSHLQWGDMHTYFEVQLSAPASPPTARYGSASGPAAMLHRFPRLDPDDQQPVESDLYR